jgi:light-regulated signal transduction histidine kinase (bacteriophytochrome)
LFPCYDAIRIFAAYRRVIETGESLRTEFSYHSDILSGWFDISAVKWGKNRVVISFSDVSAIKKVQVELEKTVHELKRSNKSLEEFAYAASHDLQEPLRKIQLFSDRLHLSLASQLDTAQQNMFSRIFTSAERLRMLIDNLITFSSINQQPSAFEKVSLQQVVGDVLLEFDDVIKDKAALVQVDELPTVCGDRMQLHQLFQNLVSNALKYTKAGQSPKVHVRSSTVSAADAEVGKNGSACEKRYLKIEIEDNGIGFDMKYAEKIFHVFQRLHGNDQYKGTGVGLSIVQKVVNNHKGIIRAQSKVGEGSCFQLLLPV